MPKLLRSPYTPAVALALLGLAYRLILLSTTLWTVDSDQAVFGLMARHILRGERPIFYYGQGYQGALEAYLTAGVFRLWGQNDLLLRLVPTLFSILLLLQLYWLALRLYGRAIAVATGLWLALAPPVLVLWGTASGAGYIEVMTIGTALFAIAIRRWGLGHPRRYDLPALGLLAGLGVWEQPIIAYYLVALAITWIVLAWRRLLGLGRGRDARAARLARLQSAVRHAWPVPVCFVLGAAPWLGYTARHRGASLSVLSGLPDPSTIPATVGRLLGEAFPILLGGSLPNTLAPDFAAYANAHQLTYALALLAMGVVLVRLLVSPGGLPAQLRALLAGRPLADAPLALLPLVTIALYLGSRFEALDWTTRNPRYLLPLYTATPYLFACVMPIATRAAIWRNARHGLAASLGRRMLLGARASGPSPVRSFLQTRTLETGDAVPCGNQPALPFHAGMGETPALPAPSSRVLVPAPPAGAVQAHISAKQRIATWLCGGWRQLVALYCDGWRELWDLYRGGARVLARPAAVVGLAVLLGINVYGSANFQDPARVTPLAAALVSRGDTAVYCYYWLAYRLAFESEEQLTPVVTTSQGIAVSPRRNNNRYLPYLTQATYARRWAYILPYDVGVPQLLTALRRYHVPYQRWRWDNASVFDGPVRPGFPPDLKLQPAKRHR